MLTMEESDKKKQYRLTIDDDLYRIIVKRMPKSGKKNTASSFASSCLRSYFESRGWLTDPEAEAGSSMGKQ